MKVAEELEFGHYDRERIYEYVESHGAAEPEERGESDGESLYD
jgi:hypothetical protein